MKQALKITLWAAGLVLYAAIQVSAQQPTTQKPNSATPEITDAMRADFFKAQAKMVGAGAEAKDAQSAYQAAIAKLQSACGATAVLQLNPNGDPVCVAKPGSTRK